MHPFEQRYATKVGKILAQKRKQANGAAFDCLGKPWSEAAESRGVLREQKSFRRGRQK